jgi:predicted alpha/beta superfamily hydrolase
MLTRQVSKIIFIFLWLFSTQAFCEDHMQTPRQIISGTWFDISSKVLGETRNYAVHLPPSYEQQKDKKYPVIYVLDGYDTRMRGVVGMIESLSYYDLNQQIPEFIIVAIPNTNRTRDLIPTKNDLIFKGKVLDKLADNSGGADTFAKFLSKELFPQIESDYRTSEVRGILGMSFGGLFAAHILLTQPDMFSHYLISDATFVWDDNYLNRTLKMQRRHLMNKNIGVFVGLANNDHLGELGITNRKWGNDFVYGLKSLTDSKLQVNSRYFPEESHSTVMFLAFYYGLIDLFKQ